MATKTPQSILAADFGSVYTRAVLIEVVEGRYRLVARGVTRTTDGFPAYDLSVGLRRAIQQISEATGRKLVSDQNAIIKPERPDRSGVDLFALTASIGRPLRAVVVGLMPDVSIQSALRAAAGTYITVMDIITLDDPRTEEEQLNGILLSYPDVILIAGGTESGAQRGVLRLAENIRRVIALIEEEQRPMVIFAGNQTLADKITELFGQLATVGIAKNVRPSLEEERLDSARLMLAGAFNRYKETRFSGLAGITRMSDTGVLPTAQSHSVLAEYLNRAYQINVALVEIGSSVAAFATSIDGRTTTSIRTDLGLGHSAPQLLDAVGLDQVRHWLPFTITEGELRNYVMNKALYPMQIPYTVRDLFIEHALIRAGIRAAIIGTDPNWETRALNVDEVIGGGAALTGTGDAAYDALLLLDATQPAGVTVLRADPFGLVPVMGAIAVHTPEAVVHLLDEINLTLLGTVIAVDGQPRKNKPALQITIQVNETGETVSETLNGGHLWVFDLPTGRTAQVSVKGMGGATIGGKRKLSLTISGGAAGLIFDGRGRPLALPVSLLDRAELLTQSIHEMTGQPLIPISADWLEEIIEAEPEEIAAAPKDDEFVPPKRRGLRRDKPADDAAAKKPRRGRRGKAAAEAEATENELSTNEDLMDELRRDILS